MIWSSTAEIEIQLVKMCEILSVGLKEITWNVLSGKIKETDHRNPWILENIANQT